MDAALRETNVVESHPHGFHDYAINFGGFMSIMESGRRPQGVDCAASAGLSPRLKTTSRLNRAGTRTPA